MIRAVIVDDEILALQHLEKLLLKTDQVEIIGMYTNAIDLLKVMKTLNFDVVFLDIEMPKLNGIEFAELIRDWNSAIKIVFVSAYRDYAIEAFELQSIDYLLKPITFDRLHKTVNRIVDQLQTSEKTVLLNETYTLKIICFNEFTVYHHNVPVKWKTAKVKELFAYLFTHLGEHIHRDTLIDNLWPEVEFERAKIQMHTTMSYLRKMLTSMGFSNAITFSNSGYTLSLNRFQCDAHQFERLISDQHLITKDTFNVFEEIVDQYSGGYLETTGYNWAIPIASEIRQKFLQLLQRLVDFFNENCNLTKTEKYLQLLVLHNPYSEHVIQQLMRHYVTVGNRGEAVRVYHDMKNLLITDFGIPPDEATTKLYESIITR